MIDLIEERLEEEFELSSLAEVAYISVAQLYRVFYALTGHPIKDYIRKRRISVSANHLRNSKLAVEEIAWMSGFETYHAFAKVFKKIVGLTPAAYRQANIFFSFEPIQLQEQVAYMEDRDQMERFPDVKVVRFMPGRMHTYLYLSDQVEGMENEGFRIVSEKLAALAAKMNVKSRVRIFGHNVEVPDEGGEPRYGYKVLIELQEGKLIDNSPDFTEEMFNGGLYAVRKISASPPRTVQEGWNRLLSEWLPRSTFEIGNHQYVEEFIAYNGKVTRMNLYLPVQRKLDYKPIEIVELAEVHACYFRGHGPAAQADAERRLIDWYEKRAEVTGLTNTGNYYMSYAYGHSADSDDYWWENGILTGVRELKGLTGLKEKRIGFSTYACCISRTYGMLGGVLENMHRWIAASGSYLLDEKRQWFAEYYTPDGRDVEHETIVKVYIPIQSNS
ncbi:helix-turn-helix domain-containing protein [Paenibacillus allorhizosphaerae]|uniref:helix-turn-helix domain-containing protein n=1 Tax=Paenibacillus allorhizosphaerae TaxID=2849866 RepID=UPI001E3A4213|nr:helix-turn-helix domain-containing protein [Paenibacillus allorhizosphaerae]